MEILQWRNTLRKWATSYSTVTEAVILQVYQQNVLFGINNDT